MSPSSSTGRRRASQIPSASPETPADRASESWSTPRLIHRAGSDLVQVMGGGVATRTALGRRLDIQGLRALAVIAVVLNHLSGEPRGGFVGVDIFFVISGFLITGQLISSIGGPCTQGQHGPMSHFRSLISAFYRRRIRRIVPAAAVVIGVTLVSTAILLPGPRASHITGDAVTAFLFVSNWHFASSGTDYFSVDRPTSPLQNFWSLSVEEQFYLIWPILVFALCLAARQTWRRRTSRGRHKRGDEAEEMRFRVALGASALTAASLWFAWYESQSAPGVAYFSTFSRAWELGIGAILAAAIPTLRMSRRWAWSLSLAGTILVVITCFTARGGTGFPAPGAILPCLGAALVIAAQHDGAGASNPILTNVVAVRLGDLSYSLYLVHFPLIITLSVLVTTHGALYYIAATAGTFGIATLLYAFVEQPVLRSALLLGARPIIHRRPAAVRAGSRWQYGGAAIALLGIAAVAYATIPSRADQDAKSYRRIAGSVQKGSDSPSATPTPTKSKGHSSASSTPHGDRSPTSQRNAASTPQGAKITRYLNDALLAKQYPDDLSPSMQSVIDGPQARDAFVACSRLQLGGDSCVWGSKDAKHVIYLTGDSTAMVWAEALAHIVDNLPGWQLRVAPAYGCHFSSVVYEIPYKPLQDGCATHTKDVLSDVAATRPDVLLVSGAFYLYRPVGAAADVSFDDYASQQLRPIQELRRYVKRAVYLEPAPGGTSPGDCYQPGTSPVACVYRPKQTWLKISSVMHSTMTAAGVTYVRSTGWFCNSAGYCPPFADGTPIMHDKSHAAPGWMDVIWPAVDEALKQRHVFG